MFQIFNPHEPIAAVTIRLLKMLNVKVASQTVNETILNHPDYPSILSISDALHSWHVNNAVIKIEPGDIKHAGLPCIAFIKKEGGAFILIEAINNDIVWYHNGIEASSFTIAEFENVFGGIVLFAEPGKDAGEKNYKHSRAKELKQQIGFLSGAGVFATLLMLSVIQFYSYTAHYSFLFACFSTLNFTGLLTSVVLLWYETDKTNPALQKMCTGSQKTNCNAVLNSRAAKIAGVGWSELGFMYFAGLFLLGLFTGFSGSIKLFSIAAAFSLPAVLYVPFSIFYQWKIIKQWCPLCLTVQVILLLQCIMVSSLFAPGNSFNFFNLALLSIAALAFAIPVAVWFILKPLLSVQQKAKEDFRALQRIKFNAEIFNALLEKQKHIAEPTDGLGITLGNENAANTLIKVCNPYCGPCAKAHPEIEKLLEGNDNLKVQIVFTATNNNDDIKSPPVKHLLAIADKNNEPLTKAALDNWYLADKKDYAVFAAKYPLNGELQLQHDKVERMKYWCDKTDIQFTPTIFFNGYQLPNAYSIGDLKYFLAE